MSPYNFSLENIVTHSIFLKIFLFFYFQLNMIISLFIYFLYIYYFYLEILTIGILTINSKSSNKCLNSS
jgi:hypothetical protein